MISQKQTAKSIFLEAIEKHTPHEWPAFLDAACVGDEQLRADVNKLLRSQQVLGSFHETPGSSLAATIAPPPSESPGTLIGPYKLLEQIGEGGMGLVYMAEQQQPVRRLVALKIVKPGMDSKQVIARFEAERQALAMMDHSNIAKVLDAGATDRGRPYFVMELVRGIPINEFCDQKRLSVRDRLALFIQVCQAVQHAHQKGIIHRDLKPTNVLVTMHNSIAVPKVIDFGIAKALGASLTEHTLHTGFAQLVGTPLYMSPEQAEMNQFGVDTRSDVYSLGVMLYELLTGTTPFDKETLTKAGFDEMRKIICQHEPPRPSARVSTLKAAVLSTVSAQRSIDPRRISIALRGELDWIVMKAMEKERSDRYESASALARDVERFLRDEPVQACPPTPAYRFRKFSRKHRTAFSTAVLVAASLLIGIIVSAWQAVRATTAEAQASAQRNEAQHQRDDAQKQRDEMKAVNDKLVATQAELQNTLYAAHTNLAHNAWELNKVNRMSSLLERCLPKPGEADLRHFEWHYLQRLSHPELLTINAHSEGVQNLAYSPDGRRLASVSQDQVVKVWDSQTGSELLSLDSGAADVRFSPDGQPLGDEIERQRYRVEFVSFSPDGTRLASGRKVWEVQSGQELVAMKSHGWIRAFSPDGKRLAGTGFRSVAGHWETHVVLWDAHTGEEIRALRGCTPTLTGHMQHVEAVAFSPDAKLLASSSNNKTVTIWDTETGQELLTLPHTGTVPSVAFTPDGKYLASGTWEGQVRFWDVATGNQTHLIRAHGSANGGAVNGLAISADGERLVTGSPDGFIKVWNTESGEELSSFRGHGNVLGVAFSPDGQRLASGSALGTIRVWDATGMRRADFWVKGRGDRVWGVAFSPDGKRAASASTSKYDPNNGVITGSQIKIWDAQTTPGAKTGQDLLVLTGHAADVWSVAFSPDGKRLASGSVDKTIKLWNSATGEVLQTLTGHTGPVRKVAFHPDGRQLASVADDKTVKIWDLELKSARLTLAGNGTSGHWMATKALAFSPDGRRLAAGSGDSVKIWDVQTGRELFTIENEPAYFLFGLAFSPDSRYLARTSNSRVKIFDTQTGQDVQQLSGHDAAVFSVAYSPDGQRLASASADMTVKIWNTHSGQEVLTLTGHTHRVYHVTFSPDGHRLASGGGLQARVMIYDATPLPVATETKP